MKTKTLIITIIFVLSACSGIKKSDKELVATNWLQDGSISISRPLPKAEELKLEHVLSFMPFKKETPWVKVSLEDAKLSVMRGTEESKAYKFTTDQEEIKAGSYKVALKQEDASWYASEEYFKNRGLKTPSKSSADRYLKGAFGDYAIFLTAELAIHSADVYDDEVGGIQISNEAAEALYNMLDINSMVVVE